MLFLYLLFAYSSAQDLPPIVWTDCFLSSTQASAGASLNYVERLANRDHWQETIDAFQQMHPNSEKRQSTYGQCATVSVPAYYSTDPSMNGTVHGDASAIQYIQVKVARYVRSPPSKLAVWHFAGGPGQDSVEIFGKLLQTLSDRYQADVYAMNLRGISGVDSSSVNFWDAMTPDQLDQQVQSMSNHSRSLLPFFNTDDDCRDLKRVIDTIYETENKQDIVLVGHSYGTYLVHRFVQIFPSVAVRAILDSTCAGPKGTIIDMGIWANVNWFPSLIQKCENDEFCSRVFEGKANATIWATLSSNKTCGGVTASSAYRFFSLWMLNQPTNFQITFAILKRLSRCNEDDQTALAKIQTIFNWDNLVSNWENTRPAPPDALNPAVMYMMRGSEFGRLPTPSPAQIAQDMAQGPFGSFLPSPTSSIYATRRTNYMPWNPRSPWANQWAPSNFTKFFLISGEIDFNTPYFLTEDFAKNVPDTQIFVVPGAGHTAGLATECGFSVLQQWIVSGGVPKSCGTGISFQVPQAVSTALGFFDWYGAVGLSNLAIGLIVAACLLVVAIIGGFIGVRMCKKKRTDEARLPLIH